MPNIFYRSYGFIYDNEDKIILKIGSNPGSQIKGVFDLVHEKWILPLKYRDIKKLEGNYYALKKNDYYVIYDLESKKIIANNKWKYINKFHYTSLEHYYLVKEDNDNAYGVYNIISKKNSIPCMYSSLRYDAKLNYFKISKKEKYNYVDRNNNLLFKNWYGSITHINDVFFVKKGNKTGIIDRNEKEIVPIKYLKIHDYNWQGTKSYFAQNEKGKYGFINLKGEITLPFIYDYIKIERKYAKLKTTDGKYGILVNKEGKINILSSCKYDEISMKNNYYIVVKDGKYGLLNAKGEKVLDEKYNYIGELIAYRKGFFLKKGTNYFLFANDKISKKKYKGIKPIQVKKTYSDWKYFAVKNNTNKYGLMNSSESMVTPYMFDDIMFQLKENYLVVKIDKKIGIYDIPSQKMIIPAKYDNIVENQSYYYGVKGITIDKIKLNPKLKIIHL